MLSASQMSAISSAFDEALEALVEDMVGRLPAEILLERKSHFEEARGRITEDHPMWESFNATFVEWLLFGAGRFDASGHQHFSDENLVNSLSDTSRVLAKSIVVSHHGVFVAKALAHESGTENKLVDIIGGAEFLVGHSPQLLGLSVGDLAELRLAHHGNELLPTKTFLHHPKRARDEIDAYVMAKRSMRASPTKIIDGLAKARVRWEHFRQLKPSAVYDSTRH